MLEKRGRFEYYTLHYDLKIESDLLKRRKAEKTYFYKTTDLFKIDDLSQIPFLIQNFTKQHENKKSFEILFADDEDDKKEISQSKELDQLIDEVENEVLEDDLDQDKLIYDRENELIKRGRTK